MKIIDGHCDALLKLANNPRLDFFREEAELDVSYPRLVQAGIKLQFFAVYISERIANPTIEHVLEMINIFYNKIVSSPRMKLVASVQDLEAVEHSGQIGALLALEGLDALSGNIDHLHMLYRLGLRSLGLTWNYANWAADGVMEPRNGGFTLKGRRLLRELQSMDMIVDVSHLSVNGFWELLELYPKPFVASHSNALQLCAHPRNLSNEQIEAIIRRNGHIGVTFVPFFVQSPGPAQVSGLLSHIDHICSLGGERHLGFGSDFDGIEEWVAGLEHAGKYQNIIEALCKNYKEEQVERFMYGNWKRFLKANLPPV